MTDLPPTPEQQRRLRQAIEDCLVHARNAQVDPQVFKPAQMAELGALRQLLAQRQAQGVAVGEPGPILGLCMDPTFLSSLDTELHSQWHDDSSPVGSCERMEMMTREMLLALIDFGFELPLPDDDSMLAKSPRINGKMLAARRLQSQLERATAQATGQPRTMRI